MREWKFEFPAEVQEERQAVLNAIDRAMEEATPEAVRTAGELAWAWVAQHPDDYAVWDAGEPLALLADSILADGVEAANAMTPEAAAVLSR